MIARLSITHKVAASSGCHFFITGPHREAVNLNGTHKCWILYMEAEREEHDLETLWVNCGVWTSAFNGSEQR